MSANQTYKATTEMYKALRVLHITPVERQIEHTGEGRYHGTLRTINFLFQTEKSIYALDEVSYLMYNTSAWRLV